MVTNEEWLDSKIALLTAQITSEFKPNQMNIHRQIVDLRQSLIKVKDYAKKIKTHTGIDIIPHVKTYLSMT